MVRLSSIADELLSTVQPGVGASTTLGATTGAGKGLSFPERLSDTPARVVLSVLRISYFSHSRPVTTPKMNVRIMVTMTVLVLMPFCVMRRFACASPRARGAS